MKRFVSHSALPLLVVLLGSVVPPAASSLGSQEAPRGAVRICAGGDVTLGTNLDTAWTRAALGRSTRRPRALEEPAALLDPLRALVADADVVLLNLEGAIGEGTAPPKCGPRSTACYAMRQPVTAATALRGLTTAPVVVNVANNHSEDAGLDGYAVTLRHLADAEVQVTGADTIATLVRTSRGDTVAFLGFSTSNGPDPRDLDGVRRHVSRAAAITPRVIVTMHMGAEGKSAQRARDSTELFLGYDRGNVVAFARVAAESGARLIFGHGPHVMRAVEWRGDALVFYSLGNLLTYGPFSVAEPMNRGALACATLSKSGEVMDARLRPTVQRAAGIVRPDLSNRAAVLADSLSRLDFPRSRAALIVESAITRPAATPPASQPARGNGGSGRSGGS